MAARPAKSLARRLDAVEQNLRQRHGAEDLPGAYELHFTDAWPKCRDDPNYHFEQFELPEADPEAVRETRELIDKWADNRRGDDRLIVTSR